jgi:hypothetical protein
MSEPYTKWKGKRVSKAKASARSVALADEARDIAEKHRQLKQDEDDYMKYAGNEQRESA